MQSSELHHQLSHPFKYKVPSPIASWLSSNNVAVKSFVYLQSPNEVIAFQTKLVSRKIICFKLDTVVAYINIAELSSTVNTIERCSKKRSGNDYPM